jgi:transposase
MIFFFSCIVNVLQFFYTMSSIDLLLHNFFIFCKFTKFIYRDKGISLMSIAYNRHFISDKVWRCLEPICLGAKGTWGGNARDNRQFINAVLWILRSGSSWRNLPKEYGDWKNTHRRFCRWRDKGVWERLLETLMDEPDFEWLITDVKNVTNHSLALGDKQGTIRTEEDSAQRYIFPWMRMVCRSERLLQRVPQRTVLKVASLSKG